MVDCDLRWFRQYIRMSLVIHSRLLGNNVHFCGLKNWTIVLYMPNKINKIVSTSSPVYIHDTLWYFSNFSWHTSCDFFYCTYTMKSFCLHGWTIKMQTSTSEQTKFLSQFHKKKLERHQKKSFFCSFFSAHHNKHFHCLSDLVLCSRNFRKIVLAGNALSVWLFFLINNF